MAVRAELLENIRTVEPYVPGEQPQEKVIKLNTNENPYPPAPGVQEALDSLDPADFRLYPDPSSGVLVKALAENYKVSEDQVFVGVGSDDVLALCFLTFLIRRSRSCSRTLHIPSTRYGQSCTGFHTSARSLTRTSVS